MILNNVAINRDSWLTISHVHSMWPKVLPGTCKKRYKKNPYIINQNHIFSKNYCEVISG